MEPDPPLQPSVLSSMPAWSQADGMTVMGRHAIPPLTAREMGLARSSPPAAIDWEREAASLTFCLDPELLHAGARDATPAATGELLWVRSGERMQSIILYVHPVLLVHAADRSRRVGRVEVVPHFRAGDPLLHHIALVLKAEITAEGAADRLYAEALAHALALHFLKRYRPCRLPVRARTSGLSKPMLHRLAEYIDAHLEHELSLGKLAAVAQTSRPISRVCSGNRRVGRPTGTSSCAASSAPSSYWRRPTCRSSTSAARSVSRIRRYFTSVFRKHMAKTPKAYRGDTHR